VKENIKIALTIDDSAFQRKHLMDILIKTKMFYKILEASNAEDAMKKCVKFVPDLILMDYDMPKMDGLTASEMILRWKKDANIIMVTAKDRDNLRKKALSIGIKEVVTKPYTEVQVVKAVLESFSQKVSNN